MNTAGKIFLSVVIVGAGIGIVFALSKNKKDDYKAPEPENEVNNDALTDADWNKLLKVAIDSEKRTGESNAIAKLSQKPILVAVAKQKFLKNIKRDQYNKIITMLEANKSTDKKVLAERDKIFTDFVINIVDKKIA